MKKIIAILFVLLFATGCSCSMNGTDVEPTVSPTSESMNTATPSVTSNTSNATKDFVDYLADEYTLQSTTMLEQLDENVMDGYSFEMDGRKYYLVQLDPNNSMTDQWKNSIQSNGQIDVDIEGLPQTMYAMLNGNYALISDSNEYMDGFKEYYDGYMYENTSNNPNEAPNQ